MWRVDCLFIYIIIPGGEPAVYWLGHLTWEQKVPGSNPDPDTTDFSNPTQVFYMGTQDSERYCEN